MRRRLVWSFVTCMFVLPGTNAAAPSTGEYVVALEKRSSACRLVAADPQLGRLYGLRAPLAAAVRGGGYFEDVDPAWSPGGTRIAYRDTHFDLHVVRPDGSRPRLVYVNVSSFSWAPDGRRLVVTSFSNAGGPGRAVILDPDRPASRRDIGPAGSAQWAGSWIFVDTESSAYGALFARPAAGGRLRRIAQAVDPLWRASPDGTRVAFVDQSSTPPMLTIRIVPGNRTVLRRPASSYSRTTLEWSPDSKRLAFTEGIEESLFLVGRDGSGLRRLVRPRYVSHLAWSGDSARLAVVRSYRNLWVVAANGTNSAPLTRVPESQRQREFLAVQWQPRSRIAGFLRPLTSTWPRNSSC